MLSACLTGGIVHRRKLIGINHCTVELIADLCMARGHMLLVPHVYSSRYMPVIYVSCLVSGWSRRQTGNKGQGISQAIGLDCSVNGIVFDTN